MTAPRPLWLRAVKRGLQGLALLVVLAATLVLLLLGTSPGRRQVLDWGVAAANQALAGKVHVQRLEQLGLYGVELRGIRLLAPAGNEVLGLERLGVRVQPWRLVRGQVVIESIEIAGGHVDLRQLEDPTRGLLAVARESESAREPSGKPTPVQIDRCTLTDLRVELPELEGSAPLTAVLGKLEFMATLGAATRLDVLQANLDLNRADTPLARLESLEALVQVEQGPSRARLTLSAGQTRLVLQAEGTLPSQQDWGTRPLAAELQVQALDPATLVLLSDNAALAESFEGPVSVELTAQGSADQLELKGDIATPAGAVKLAGSLSGQQDATLMLRTDGLTLGNLKHGLPAWSLGADWTARVHLDRGALAMEFDGATTLNARALPHLSAGGRLRQESLTELDLLVKSPDSHLHVTGDATLAGQAQLKIDLDIDAKTVAEVARAVQNTLPPHAGRMTGQLELSRTRVGALDVRGALDSPRLSVGKTRLQGLRVKLQVSGELPYPQVALDATLASLRHDELRLSPASIQVHGGPQGYRTRAQARAGDWGHGSVSVEVKPEANDLLISGRAAGQLREQPFAVQIEPTRVTAQGGVTTRGIAVELGPQRAHLRGAFAEQAMDLAFELERVELEPLSRLLGVEPSWQGVLTASGRARGSLSQPELQLELRGNNLGLARRPPVNLELEVALDTRQGELTASAQLSESATPGAAVSPQNAGPTKNAPFGASLRLHTQFAPARDWVGSLLQGQHDLGFELDAARTELIEAYVGRSLLVEGAVNVSAQARGSQADPTLHLAWEGKLRPLGTSRPLALQHRTNLVDGKLDSTLTIDDEHGPWLALAAHLAFAGEPAGPSLQQILEQLPHVASDSPWEVEAQLEPRTLEQLELPEQWQQAAPALSLRADWTLTHAPGQEPEGLASVRFEQTRPYAAFDGCSADSLRAELTLQLAEGQAHLALSAADRERELLHVAAEGTARLASALAGGEPELAALTVSAKATRLPLSNLPFVCRRAQGYATLGVSLHRPLDPEARAELQLSLDDFSFGSKETVDASLALAATRTLARLDGQLVAGDDTSRLRAQIPIAWTDQSVKLERNKPWQASLELHHVPLAPWIAPRGAVSYASGSVSGQVQLAGSAAAPDFNGKLVLEDIAFTATDLAQPLRNVSGTLAFSEQALSVQHLVAHDGDGALGIDGALSLSRLFDPARFTSQGEFMVKAEQFPVRQAGQVVATTDATAKVALDFRAEETRVTLQLTDFDTWLEDAQVRQGLALGAHPDVSVDGGTAGAEGDAAIAAPAQPDKVAAEPAASASTSERNTRRTVILIDARDKFWVKRSDFAIKLAAQLKATVDGEEARVTGAIQLDRGYLELLGKVFEVERGGELRFAGGAVADPILDFAATHSNRRTGQIIKVHITGRGSKPQLAFSVDDSAVTAGDAFTAIYDSQNSSASPGDAESQANQFVAGLTAGLLATSARRELGALAPILSIDPGDTAGEGQVRAGFELDALIPGFLRRVITGVYVEGIVSQERQNDTSGETAVQRGVLLELYFPSSLVTSGRYGPGSTWSLDLGWQP